MTTYYVRAGSQDQPVSISDRDFVASGGEKKVYAKGNTAYCVYHDPKHAVPLKKIAELAAVKNDGFVAPRDILLDSQRNRVGETMPFLKQTFVLCQLFSNAFRRKNGVDHAIDLEIIGNMISIMEACHGNGIVLVDPNDKNWLVSKDFSNVFLIDTTSCQTSSFRGTAIMPGIYDPICKKSFTMQSDYFSLAVVITWLWSGIHPFACIHRGSKAQLEGKMKTGLWILSPTAELNSACRDIKSMPRELLKWVRTCFESKDRPAPPAIVSGAVVPAAPVVLAPVMAGVKLEKLRGFPSDIVDVSGPYTMTTTSLYFETKKLGLFAGVIAFEESTTEAIGGTTDEIRSFRVAGSAPLKSQAVIRSGGRLYAMISDSLVRVDTRTVNGEMRVSTTKVARLADMPNATLIGDGCIVQDLLGRKVVTSPDGVVVLDDLEKSRVLYAKYLNGVLMLSALTAQNAEVRTYLLNGNRVVDSSVRVVSSPSEPNFTVISAGIVVENRNGELVAYHKRKHGQAKAAKVDPDLTLFTSGGQVLGALGRTLYRVRMG